MAHIAFIGNCQFRAIFDSFNRFVAPWSGDTTILLDAYKLDLEAAKKELNGVDLVVEQVADLKANGLDALAPNVPRCLIPVVSAGFLWPFAGQPHPKNTALWYRPLGQFGAESGDSYLNKLILKGSDPDEALRRYVGLNVGQVINLDRLFEIHMDRQRSRDEITGFATAGVIEQFFQEEPLFRTPYHPNIRIARYLIVESLRRLGADAGD